MKAGVIAFLGVLCVPAWAPVLHAGVVGSYTDCEATIVDGKLLLDPLPENRVFAEVLDRFLAEPRGSSPESYLLSGRVVSNNNGMPVEGVAVSLRAPGRSARLAAISSDDGRFRFEVWIGVEPQGPAGEGEGTKSPSSLRSLEEGELLLGGTFAADQLLVSGTVSKYNLSELVDSRSASNGSAASESAANESAPEKEPAMTETPNVWYGFRSAIYDGDFELAEKLLKEKPELIHLTNGLGETALHFLAVENDIKGVVWLRARGADIDSKNEFGTPVLFEVANLGYKKLFLWFVEQGVDLQALDGGGLSLTEHLLDFDKVKMVDWVRENSSSKPTLP